MKDRFRLFHFDPASEAADAAESGESSDVAGADAPAETPSYLTADDIQPLVQFQQAAMPVLSQLGEILNSEDVEDYGGEALEGEAGGADPDEFDPYDPAVIQELARREAQQMLEPFSGILGMVAQEKGEQLARNAMDSIKSDIGEFDPDVTLLISQSILNDPNARSADPTTTLRGVAQWVQERDQRVASAAVEAYKAEMAALAGAPRGEVAGAGAAATEIERIPMAEGSEKYSQAVARAMARRNPSPVV